MSLALQLTSLTRPLRFLMRADSLDELKRLLGDLGVEMEPAFVSVFEVVVRSQNAGWLRGSGGCGKTLELVAAKGAGQVPNVAVNGTVGAAFA